MRLYYFSESHGATLKIDVCGNPNGFTLASQIESLVRRARKRRLVFLLIETQGHKELRVKNNYNRMQETFYTLRSTESMPFQYCRRVILNSTVQHLVSWQDTTKESSLLSIMIETFNRTSSMI